ncbi:BTAD domain-containing putative transcriptional regulator [Amycolatopsis jiangsuensis]|uniref:DNA-binding SARP family transcriptional activator n=1 Tax=Amycolatopsis jiangsuensis TaxID=1181879 RepID=A0A840IY12_9PSEU|nr:BTAD domain-containing putative transcriptional regulator [Amycolatopsis jiangsuensis]MBB4686177.1 DNA-binding SARP family transcriptional activator [Amycolatopsis jiangsuensis]
MDLSFSVLGPLAAHDPRGPVALPGPRHRAVLARLLVARGQVVSVDALVEALWGEPRAGAVGAVQTFVGALRRALEPDRPPRTPSALLVTEAPGYALRAAADQVDAWRFEAVLREDPFVERLDEALGWWRGEPYAEFAGESWVRGEISRLTELRLLALERRAAGLLELGRAAEVVPDLESHVDAQPLREEAWRLFVLALYRAGRQGAALAALRRARAVLAEELGVDPGPALRQLERDVLAQAPGLTPPSPLRARLAGRAQELAALAEAAGHARLILVSGEAGVGKSALVTDFAARLGRTTACGTNPDDAGVPPAWPWTRILHTLGQPVPPRERATDPAVARFHWQQAVVARLADVARRGPLLLVLEDLHWAGEETLSLLTAVVAEPMPVLVVATYRTTDVSAALSAALGRLARADPVRLYLNGLSVAAVAELAGKDGAQVIHRRTGGNPFFVKELMRVRDVRGDLPDGVRDVVRHRLDGVSDDVRAVLRKAAVVGADLDPGLLGDVTAELEIAVNAGFLVTNGPRRFRFAHALVRDAVYENIPMTQRRQLHLSVGEALVRRRPGDVSLLAHHFLRAGDDRGVGYARVAAERAERDFAPHEAVRLGEAALAQGPRTAEVLMGLARTTAITGSLAAARRYRGEALDLAGADLASTRRVLTAFDVPGVWTDNDDPALARRIADAAGRVLEAETDPSVRARLLATIALELRSAGGAHAHAAAAEAEELARASGDPALLALALNARWTQSFTRAGLAPERGRIGAELVESAGRHRLVTFEVLGHLVLVQARSALADFAAADEHAAAADRLGEQYRLPLVAVFTEWYRALRLAVTGPLAAAEAAYRSAAVRLAGSEMPGLTPGMPELARQCLYRQHGRPSTVDPIAERPDLFLELSACSTIPDTRAEAARRYALLTPAADELAGAGSGFVTLGPVAHFLGDLATMLDRPATAHYRQAAEVARRAGAKHWVASAERAATNAAR